MKIVNNNRVTSLKLHFFDIIVKILDFFLKIYNLTFLTKIKKIILGFKADIILVVEEKGKWVIDWIGKYISRNINKTNMFQAEVASPLLAQNKIIHYGSINCVLNSKGLKGIAKSNINILSWYHFREKDTNLKLIGYLNEKLHRIITPSVNTKNNLIKMGFDKDKISIIPLGVDLTHFKAYGVKKRANLKDKFKLPKNKIIIGSFQKDGVGWGEGLKPKLIKGPDIFCEVVKKLNDDFKIHIFLTGPARGYVKKKLDDYSIPYTHVYIDYYPDIVECYNVLDLYLITSRVEGGPMALLECMATGIPLITTNVGMASYVIKNGVNGFITDIENLDQIYIHAKNILTNNELRAQIIKNGFNIVQDYSWEKIVNKYYLKIYQNLLNIKNK